MTVFLDCHNESDDSVSIGIVVVTFNNVIIISTLTSMQQEFSSQTVTLYPQGGQLAGYKRTSWFQFINLL